MIEISCSGCGRALKVGLEHAGKMARCPLCGHITQVPGPLSEGEPQPISRPEDESSGQLWLLQTPEGQEYGPATRAELDRWVSEGRVTADCRLRQGASGQWRPADAVYPELAARPAVAAELPRLVPAAGPHPTTAQARPYFGDHPTSSFVAGSPPGHDPYAPRTAAYLAPHRGPVILVLGIVGIVTGCVIFSLIAWVMGSNDLREMQAGRMDPSGMDLTRAGQIMGMIISILHLLAIVGFCGLIFLGAILD
jgi:hypothetical protein